MSLIDYKPHIIAEYKPHVIAKEPANGDTNLTPVADEERPKKSLTKKQRRAKHSAHLTALLSRKKMSRRRHALHIKLQRRDQKGNNNAAALSAQKQQREKEIFEAQKMSRSGPVVAATVEHLEPGNIYQFRVAASNAKGEAAFSKPTFSIMTLCQPPTQPTNVRISRVTPFSAKIRWSPSMARGEILTHYTVLYTAVSDDDVWLLEKNRGLEANGRKNKMVKNGRILNDVEMEFRHQLSKKAMPQYVSLEAGRLRDPLRPKFEIQGLLPGTFYAFSVAAKNRMGYSLASSISKITKTGSTIPAEIETPQSAHASCSSMTFSWRAPVTNGSELEAFVVHIREGDSLNGVILPEIRLREGDVQPHPKSDRISLQAKCLYYDGEFYSLRCDNLSASMIYSIRVAAINGVGQGPFSVFSDGKTTLPPEVPSMPSKPCAVGLFTPVSMPLSWGASLDGHGSPILGYVIAQSMRDHQKEHGIQKTEQPVNISGQKEPEQSILLQELLPVPCSPESAVLPIGFNAVRFVKGRDTLSTDIDVVSGRWYSYRAAAVNEAGLSQWTSPSTFLKAPTRLEFIAIQHERKYGKAKGR
tara:strand:+ start:106 stop:1860 length:1755 start_codon:yes stop_codon:yes gene_type:complete